MVRGDPGVPLRSLPRRNPHSRNVQAASGGHWLALTAGHSGDQAELVPVLRKKKLTPCVEEAGLRAGVPLKEGRRGTSSVPQ